MKYVNLNEYNLDFKNLISGPAPAGRILNYIILAGKKKLYHKNGNRDLKLKDNVGSAWCIEFMVGLNLVEYKNQFMTTDNKYLVRLTNNGERLFRLIQGAIPNYFDENNDKNCRAQLWGINIEAFNEFRKIFISSPICKNLYSYIVNNNSNVFGSTFFDDYFGFFKKMYTGEDYVINTNETTTGKNRVPSLTQLCSFFGLCEKNGDSYIFDKNGLNKNFVEEPSTSYINNENNSKGENLIVYGTPGCGKSYYVEYALLKDVDKEKNAFRTTFYQDYSNTDFIGQILPTIKKDDSNNDIVTYEFIPGPFAIALKRAYEVPDEKVALVIEEINRGNAPSIFGDIFQLLDRKDCVSEYPIKNINLMKYLNDALYNGESHFEEIKIPSNLFLYATMNTSDQNVFTLDTAFKRRWKFLKLVNTFNNEHPYKDYKVPGSNGVTWETLVNDLNNYILEKSNGLNAEDKQLGVFFLQEDALVKPDENDDNEEKKKAFAYKVFEYLWDDVAKFDRETWFGEDIKSLDELIDEYMKDGMNVFKDGQIK